MFIEVNLKYRTYMSKKLLKTTHNSTDLTAKYMKAKVESDF
jgi:hypothetical protein